VSPAELAAREAIRDLVARYNALGDAGRLDELAELFCPDAELVVERRPQRGRAAIRALFEAAAGEARAGGGIRVLRHFTATHAIDLLDDAHARGRCYYLVLTEHGLDHWGRYDDRYRLDGEGRWRFERRAVTVDGLVPGGWAERASKRVRG
jgi:uncharacterized protein (TIGR02246 family)